MKTGIMLTVSISYNMADKAIIASDEVISFSTENANKTVIKTRTKNYFYSLLPLFEITEAIAAYEAMYTQALRPTGFRAPISNQEREILSYMLDLTGEKISVTELSRVPEHPDQIFRRTYPVTISNLPARPEASVATAAPSSTLG